MAASHIIDEFIVKRTLPALIGYGAAYSVIIGAYSFTGGRLSGPPQDPNEDGYAKKMALRTNFRRPIQETIDELGEGRGNSHDERTLIRTNMCQVYMLQATLREDEKESNKPTE